jgi:hypothetical protein
MEEPTPSPRTALSSVVISSGSRCCSSKTWVTISSRGGTSNWATTFSIRSRFSTVSMTISVLVFCSGNMRPLGPSIGIRSVSCDPALFFSLRKRCTT